MWLRVPLKSVRTAVAGQYENRRFREQKLEVAVVPPTVGDGTRLLLSCVFGVFLDQSTIQYGIRSSNHDLSMQRRKLVSEDITIPNDIPDNFRYSFLIHQIFFEANLMKYLISFSSSLG